VGLVARCATATRAAGGDGNANRGTCQSPRLPIAIRRTHAHASCTCTHGRNNPAATAHSGITFTISSISSPSARQSATWASSARKLNAHRAPLAPRTVIEYVLFAIPLSYHTCVSRRGEYKRLWLSLQPMVSSRCPVTASTVFKIATLGLGPPPHSRRPRRSFGPTGGQDKGCPPARSSLA